MKTSFVNKFISASLVLAGGVLSAGAQYTWDPGLSGGSGGAGAWNLTAAIWYNGTADVRWTDTSATGTNTAVFGGTAGTVTLGTSLVASNLNFTTPGYTLSGAGPLTLGGGINASGLSSGTTTISTPLALPAAQQLWQVGSGATLAVKGALTRNQGASIDFTTPGVNVTSALLANDATGVIGGWATINDTTGPGADWAANDGSGNIIAYSGYTIISATGSTTQNGAGAAAQNWLTGAFDGNNYITTLSASATINSLVQQGDFAVGNGVTLTLGNGGLLLSGYSRWLLGNSATTSFLTSGASTGELFVHVPENDGNANNWTIWPIIKDNGATPVTLVKDGYGQVKLGNQNTFTGGLLINAGTVATTAGAEYGQGYGGTGLLTTLGLGSVSVANGAELQLGVNAGNTSAEYDYTNAIALNSGTIFEYDAFQHVQGPLTIGAGGGTLGATYDNDTDGLNKGFAKGLFVDGAVAGTGPLTVQHSMLNTGNPWNSSTVYFTSQAPAAQNPYSGTVTVNPFVNGGSYLYLIGTNVLANATLNLTGDNSATTGRFGAPALLFGAGTNGNGTGYATIGGLTGSGDVILADTKVVQGGGLAFSRGNGVALTVGNNNASTAYTGILSGPGGIIKTGAGTLTLGGLNTYTGITAVTGGDLILTGDFPASTNITVGSGATLDVSAVSPVTLPANAILANSGTIKGSLSTAAGTQIYTSPNGGYHTNVVTGSLTLASGAVVNFDLGTQHNGANDLVTVGGTLTANNNIIHIKAPATSASLQAADYVLFTAPSIAGSFAGIAWDVAPVNAGNFSLVTSATTVTLHFAATTAPAGGGFATPATVTRNQNVLVSVLATNGTGGSVVSVTLNASPIGGSASVALVNAGGNLWTNSVAVAAGAGAGSYSLAATLTDTVPLTGVAYIPLTVTVANDVWNGLAGNALFGSNLNWTNKAAPGLTGDSLEFAGGANTSPDVNNNYTVTGVTFDSTAGSFNIGSAEGDTLTLAGNGPLVNNSINPQTLNVTLGDTGGGLTKSGNGLITLAGNNTYTGPTVVSAGTLNISGSVASTANILLGNVAGDSLLDITGAGSLAPYYLLLGNVSGAVAAVYQTGGTLNAAANSGYDNLSIGNFAGSYGYYDAIGGTATVNGMAVAGENNNGVAGNFGGPGGNGILDINGGTLNCTGWLVVARNANAQTGVVNIYSGALTYAGGGLVCNWGSGQTTIINVLGGSLSTTAGNEIGFLGGTGIVNLLGGVATVSAINGAWTGTGGAVNFNGGTLQAYQGNNNFLQVNAATVYSGGGTIDDNGQPITIAQPFLPATGNGVQGIASFTGGAGYIAPPIVTITAGAGDTTGTGATAIAQINPVTGTVTNVLITSPGVNYTATPVFTVSGGGATTPATITGAAPVANGSGGLTFLSSGGTTLTGVSTYTGATVVTNGTLLLTGNGALTGTTNIIVESGATFDVSGLTAFTLGGNQTLSGDGLVNGSVSTTAGSGIAAGPAGSYGTNTFNGNLALASGAAVYLNLGTAFAGANDQIVVEGSVTANGNSIHLKAPSTASSLDTTADYLLISAPGGINGNFASAPIWDVLPVNAGHYSIVTSSTAVTLHYSAAVSSPSVVASASPTSLSAYQTTKITAKVAPGSGNITSVSIDVTPLGGSVVSLVRSNLSNVYTNTITVPPAAAPGTATLTVTVTDNTPLSGSANVALTITTTGEVWNGGGGNPNWSTGANWAGGFPPAYAGDPLTFAGTAGLTPNVDNNYSIPSLTFSNTAGSFNIGSANGSTLTLTGTGSIVNNSANAQTLNVTITDAGNGLTKSGNGAVTLAGNNTYTGPTVISAGALNVSGSLASTANVIVGSSPGDAVLDVTGAGNLSPYYLLVGNVSNAVGAVYQTGGTLNASSASGYDNLSLGNVPGSYGYFDAAGGTFNINGICIGGEANNGNASSFGPAGNGIMDINGGTVVDPGWLVIARNNNTTTGSEIGILNVFNGSLTYAGGGIVGPWDTGETAIINILGGSVANTGNVGVYLGNAGYPGILNLNGGVLQASIIAGYNGPSYSVVTYGELNFNGGTLQASAASGGFITVSTANIYSGGATINNGGNNITINQPLLAPAGNGVNGIASFTHGAGYIAPPIVQVVPGAGDTTGTGATAIAQINPITGTVTNVLVTSPGINYTAIPTFVLSGGGATTPATITGEAPTANVSGGLTATGTGVTTLAGANTYTGNTTVSGGTLEIVNPVLAPISTVSIASGALLQLDFATTNTVSGLVLDGVSQPTGVYNSITSPAYFTGSGSLLVGTPIASNPTNITFTVMGSSLNLAWPADHLGWILQDQTNSWSVGLGTNWVDVPGSAATTSAVVPIVSTNPAVFYRLRHP